MHGLHELSRAATSTRTRTTTTQLEPIYAHLDSTTTVGAAVPGGSRGADAADWGQLVSSSQGGHLSTFVNDLGGGELTVTFVIWA